MKSVALFIILQLLFYCQLAAQTQNEHPLVKVLIIDNADSVQMGLNQTWNIAEDTASFSAADSLLQIEIGNDQISMTKNGIDLYHHPRHIEFKSDDGTMLIRNVPYGKGWWWEGKEDRIYHGEITFYLNAMGKIDVTVQLPMEEYLKGVVPYEIGGDSPLEALKAQAVAARSEAITALQSGFYSGPYYDLSSDVECQVFAGDHKRTFVSDTAVETTSGLILSENGKPIHAYYASNCGGHSEYIKNVWPERPAPETYKWALVDAVPRTQKDLSNEDSIKVWIKSRPQVFCNPDLLTALPDWSRKNFRWKMVQDIGSISRMLDKEKKLGLLREIKALKRGPSGRMLDARIVFETDSFDVKGELNIRQLWQPPLRSSCFYIEKNDDSFILSGAGWGHGVGMCQSGAIAQALLDRDFKSILKHYYPYSQLQSLYRKDD